MAKPKASPEQIQKYLEQCLVAKEKGLEVKIFWTTYRDGYPESINVQGHVVSYHVGMGQVTLEVVGFNLKKIPEIIMLDIVTCVEEILDPADLHKKTPSKLVSASGS